ncbi:MAG: XRE family transcriptional regulator [Parachlamydiaceae bacterium]|nr:XRE family transcriptional regulator [Parachlamydiaceae bacterium]
MAKKREEKVEVSTSSGNVFADLGFANPVEALAKSDLAILIYDIIKKRKLTQKAAAEILGIDQPKVSNIICGRLSGYTLDRLMKHLVTLGYDIEITAKQHHSKNIPAGVHVVNASKQPRLSF